MSFKLGPKVLIVNDAAQAQLLFFAKIASGVKKLVETDDDYQTATAFDQLATSPDTGPDSEGAGFLPAAPSNDETIAQADFLRIAGFVDLEGVDIVEVIGSKGISEQKQVSTVTFTVPVAVQSGDEITVELAFQSANLESEFASHLSDYKRKRTFTIVAVAADTATTLATKLKNDILGIIDAGWAKWVDVSSAAGVVTLTSVKGSLTFTASFSGTAISSGRATAVHAVTTTGYEGRNTYDQLKSLRLETVNGAYVEDFKSKQVPLKGAKYSCYLIKKTVRRPDLSGSNGGINTTPTAVFEFQIYINEATSGTYLLNLIKWLNANVARRIMYSATTANAAIAAENPTATTVVDSSEVFTDQANALS